MAQTLYCDVALPVPLDAIFTYEAGELEPVAGGRVWCPLAGARRRNFPASLREFTASLPKDAS